MAITNTSKSKEFIAGSSPIILKGDYRPTKMASDPDMTDSLNDLANELFDKNLDLLTPEEMDMLREEAERLSQKFMADGGRAQYGLGSLVKSIGKAVKGVVRGVKDNPLLAAAALNFAPMLLPGGAPFIGMGKLSGSLATLPKFSNLLGLKEGADKMNALKVGGAGAIITGLLSGMEQQKDESNEDFENRKAQVRDQLNVQFRRLYPQGGNESDERSRLKRNRWIYTASWYKRKG
jgi:hypothetical protein